MLKLAKFSTFLVKVLKSAEFAKKARKCEKCGFYAPWRPSRFLACISNENGALFGPFLLKVAFGRKSAFFSEKGGKVRFSHFWAGKCAFPRKGWNFVCIRWDHLQGGGGEMLRPPICLEEFRPGFFPISDLGRKNSDLGRKNSGLGRKNSGLRPEKSPGQDSSSGLPPA